MAKVGHQNHYYVEVYRTRKAGVTELCISTKTNETKERHTEFPPIFVQGQHIVMFGDARKNVEFRLMDHRANDDADPKYIGVVDMPLTQVRSSAGGYPRWFDMRDPKGGKDGAVQAKIAFLEAGMFIHTTGAVTAQKSKDRRLFEADTDCKIVATVVGERVPQVNKFSKPETYIEFARPRTDDDGAAEDDEDDEWVVTYTTPTEPSTSKHIAYQPFSEYARKLCGAPCDYTENIRIRCVSLLKRFLLIIICLLLVIISHVFVYTIAVLR